MSESGDEVQAGGVTLGELIRRNKGASSYEDLAIRSGGRLTRGSWHALSRSGTTMKAFPSPGSLVAIAETLGISLRSVVLAAARSVGLDVPERHPAFAARLPAGVDTLDDHEQLAVLTLVRSLVELHAKPGGDGRNVTVELRNGETEIGVSRRHLTADQEDEPDGEEDAGGAAAILAELDPNTPAKPPADHTPDQELPKVARRATPADRARRAAHDQHAE